MLDFIVIGAGPGGIVCIKELLEQKVGKVVCLEQSGEIGGVFAKGYDNLVLTSSATMSMFSDFWLGDGNQHSFWTKKEAVDYWTRYAKHYGVIDHIRFHSKVESVRLQKSGSWEVKLTSQETLKSKRIAIAIGNNSLRSYPAWKDLLIDVEYSHSQEYRNAEQFPGKNVLVVGGGESGSDIALEISRVAKQCWVSLRNTTGWVVPRQRGIYAADIATHRGIWGLPRNYGSTFTEAIYQAELSQKHPLNDTIVALNKRIKAEKGIWGIFATKTISLPKAIVEHDCKVVGEIIKVEDGGRKLHTSEGEVLTKIDAVVFATGYKNHVSFLPEELQKTDPRSLYKHMFHQQYGDKLAWIGWARPNFGSQFPIMEMQARFLALIAKGEKTLPIPSQMERVICIDRAAYLEQFEHNALRIRSLVDYHRYMDDIASLIGCEPPLWQYFFLHPRIWLRMVYGATQGTQFRLRGPGNKESLAQEFLMKLPVSKLNHVVKTGLKGRLIYTLKALIPKWNIPTLIYKKG